MNLHEELAGMVLISTVRQYVNREKVTTSLLPLLSRFIFQIIKSESIKNNPNLSVIKLESIIFNNDTHPIDINEFDGRQWRNYANEGRSLKPTRAREIISRATDTYLIDLEIGLMLWYFIDICESASRAMREFSKPNETIIFSQKTQQLMHSSTLKHYEEIQRENKTKYEVNGKPHTSTLMKKACMIGSNLAFTFNTLTSNMEDFKDPEFIGNVMLNLLLAEQNIDDE